MNVFLNREFPICEHVKVRFELFYVGGGQIVLGMMKNCPQKIENFLKI